MENDRECPICYQENQKILSKIRQPDKLLTQDEFSRQLSRSSDGFSSMIDMLSRGEILVQPDPKIKTAESGDEMTDAIPIAPSSKLLANRAKIAASLKSQSYASSYGSGSDVTANSFRTSGGARNQPLNSKSKPQNRSFDLDLGGTGQVPSKIEVEPEKNFFRKNSSDVQPPVQPKTADLNPFGDDPDDNSTNPFDDDVTMTSRPPVKSIPEKTKLSNPFGEVDEAESSNPFGDDEIVPSNPFGEPEPTNPFGEPEDEEFDASNPFA